MKGIFNSLLFISLRLILGGIFLYAGIVKMGDVTSFAADIAGYQILPYFGNYAVAAVLPWVESICGILLITGYRAAPAALLVIVLNLFFIGALTAALYRGLDISCGCFRQTGESSITSALIRDLFFLSMAVYVYLKASAKELTGKG